MKTIPALQIICSLALSGSLLSGCTASSKTAAAALEEQPDTLNIAVATDLHFLSSSLTDHGSAFEKYITNSDGKTMEYSEELVDAFLSEVIAEKPHVLVLTGDLTYNGEKQSHVDLSRKLQAVEDAGIQVCVIPGNHDMNSTVFLPTSAGTCISSIQKQERITFLRQLLLPLRYLPINMQRFP